MSKLTTTPDGGASRIRFLIAAADAAQDNAQHLADVENFLQQGIDLLIISPNEALPLTNMVAAACAENVPVIVLDRKANGERAAWREERGHRPCTVLEIRGLEGATPAQEQGDGFREDIASEPAVTIIASQNSAWPRERAIPASRSMLQANPDVHVVYTHNDPMTEAATISAQNAGLNLDDILCSGIDALPTPDGGIRSVIDGRIDVTYVYPTGSQQAIDHALQIIGGGPPPAAEVVLETEEVTADNVDDLLEKYVGGDAGTPAP